MRSKIPPLLVKQPVELIDLSQANLSKPPHKRRLLYTTYIEVVNLSEEALAHYKNRRC